MIKNKKYPEKVKFLFSQFPDTLGVSPKSMLQSRMVAFKFLLKMYFKVDSFIEVEPEGMIPFGQVNGIVETQIFPTCQALKNTNITFFSWIFKNVNSLTHDE